LFRRASRPHSLFMEGGIAALAGSLKGGLQPGWALGR
jgi:hypothetical protein